MAAEEVGAAQSSERLAGDRQVGLRADVGGEAAAPHLVRLRRVTIESLKVHRDAEEEFDMAPTGPAEGRRCSSSVATEPGWRSARALAPASLQMIHNDPVSLSITRVDHGV